MSLRSQIHNAIDEVAPPAPTLERRVRAFLLTDGRDRKRERPQRQPRWVAPLGLIGAALVLALVAGLFIGGRFWRTQNAPPSTVNQNDLKSLENRPLNYPTVAAGAPCPDTPKTLNSNYGIVIGSGPVYVVNGEVYESGEWGHWTALYFAGDRQTGLVLIRARDLQSNAEVAFAQYPLGPTGLVAAGRVLGTAHVVNHKVTLRSEATGPVPIPKGVPYPAYIVLFGMQTGSSGCIGFQVDGSGFTENFVLQPGVPGV